MSMVEAKWRGLAIAAPGMDEGWVGGDEVFELVEHAETGRGMGGDFCAAGDEMIGEIGLAAVEDAEAAGPPVGAGVGVGARRRGGRRSCRCCGGRRLRGGRWRLEGAVGDGVVEAGLEIGVVLEDAADGGGIIGEDSGGELAQGVGHGRILVGGGLCRWEDKETRRHDPLRGR